MKRLFLTTALVAALSVPGAAFAGFELKGLTSMAVPMGTMQTMDMMNSATGPVYHTAPTNSQASGLTVSNERFVPAHIQHKYGLTNKNWNPPSSLQIAPPTMAPPPPMAVAPPVMYQEPVAQQSYEPLPLTPEPPIASAPMPMEPVTLREQPIDIVNVAPSENLPVVDPYVPPAVPVSIHPMEGLDSAPTPPAQIVDTWRARKGEDVRQVLQRWTERSGTQFVWAAEQSSTLKKDFSYIGSMNDAVAKILKDAGVQNLHSQYRPQGMNPVMTSAAATEQVTSSESSLNSKGGGDETRWFALTGASLEAVLKVWAEDAGAQVIWEGPDRNFAVKSTVSAVGTFEQAVLQILNQYEGDPVRPVGELYAHPETGQKILVLKADTDIAPYSLAARP